MELKKSMQLILCASLITGALPLASTAADSDVVYGTMQIPYDAFYAAEGVASDVDAVSSATTSKWKNENLTAGTYNSENADGSGTILGVVYPVAISQADLDALGDNTYGFVKLDSAPAAYKEVTVSDGTVSFSAVKGASSEITGVTATITASTAYGDYCIEAAVNNANGTSDVGRIFGILLETKNGDTYAMRHLENIWRDQIAWSSGIVTEERHGNKLSYEDYESIIGQTITKITYITDSGYHTLSTELYVPVKFENTLKVENADISAGKTSVSLSGFPQDYSKKYSVDGLDATVTDSSITFKNAAAGKYTLVVSDGSGKYADVSTSFTLTTDSVPASVSGNKLVKADKASDADFSNFVKNISTVKVGENSYAASGKHSVKIIGADGTIDVAAASGDTKIFATDGEYAITVSATGYNKALSFKVKVSGSTLSALTEKAEAVTAPTTEKSDVTSAPQTADTLGFVTAAVLAGATALGLYVKKKEN